jgi:hypothetical protein
LGTLAVIYEVANPGLGLAGTVGVILLILGFFALSALLILAAGLFIGELFVPGIGVLAAGGTLALIVGGLLRSPAPTARLSPPSLGFAQHRNRQTGRTRSGRSKLDGRALRQSGSATSQRIELPQPDGQATIPPAL